MCDSVSFCLPEAAAQLSVESCAFCMRNFILTCRGFDSHHMITTDPTQFQMLAVWNGDLFGRLNSETAKSRQNHYHNYRRVRRPQDEIFEAFWEGLRHRGSCLAIHVTLIALEHFQISLRNNILCTEPWGL